MGRRMADHVRDFSRSRAGILRRADPDLHADRRLVPILYDAARDHGGDSILAGGYHTGPRSAARFLFGSVDDRLHRGGRYRGAQLDHPGGFYRAKTEGGYGAGPS